MTILNLLDKTFSTRNIVVVVIAALAFIGVSLVSMVTPKPQPSTEVATTVVLHDSAKQAAHPAVVKHYAPKIKKKLELPKAVQEDYAKVVLVASDLPVSKKAQTVTTVLDLSTGEAVQYVQRKSSPFFEKQYTGRVETLAGFLNGQPSVRVQATQDMFSIKEVTFGVTAAVDINLTQDTNTFIGVSARYEW